MFNLSNVANGWGIGAGFKNRILIYFLFSEGGVDLVPKRGCLLALAYYAFLR
jgi:hypothetical protein